MNQLSLKPLCLEWLRRNMKNAEIAFASKNENPKLVKRAREVRLALEQGNGPYQLPRTHLKLTLDIANQAAEGLRTGTIPAYERRIANNPDETARLSAYLVQAKDRLQVIEEIVRVIEGLV